MKRLNFKMLVCAVLALVCIGVATSYASGCSPTEIVCSVMQSDVSLTALAIAPVAAISIPQVDLNLLKIVSVEEFQKLQKAHGKLYVLDIQIDEDENYQFIAKRPSKNLLSAIADNKDDLDKANELILKNMIVAGNMEALEDGVVYGSLMKEVANIMQQGKSFLSKA